MDNSSNRSFMAKKKYYYYDTNIINIHFIFTYLNKKHTIIKIVFVKLKYNFEIEEKKKIIIIIKSTFNYIEYIIIFSFFTLIFMCHQ
ncbi:hypothetical protein PFTANZ_04961 [Plasmodium falciparum Tanzania (2000708)]|uniref:Uncharacterized protein n=1 Tax=Plasmodium falciparum Tanzania (2000708) TaxID=1036725 RepID=A0A024W293_PLAFA|nr:hypothetical protein PFTANZ_04961 [Plasmodium falciparum Tanzania (2000708)]